MRTLARELWPAQDQPEALKVGMSLKFESRLHNEIQNQFAELSSYIDMSGPGDQSLEISGAVDTKTTPREPFVITKNRSNENMVELTMVDADGKEFNLTALSKSQIPIPISQLAQFGLLF